MLGGLWLFGKFRARRVHWSCLSYLGVIPLCCLICAMCFCSACLAGKYDSTQGTAACQGKLFLTHLCLPVAACPRDVVVWEPSWDQTQIACVFQTVWLEHIPTAPLANRMARYSAPVCLCALIWLGYALFHLLCCVACAVDTYQESAGMAFCEGVVCLCVDSGHRCVCSGSLLSATCEGRRV